MNRRFVISAIVILGSFALLALPFLALRETEDPDFVIVRNEADRFLRTPKVEITKYSGSGGGGDSIWWARIKVDGLTASEVVARLKEFERQGRLWSYEEQSGGPALSLPQGYQVPDWWTANTTLYGVRLQGNSSGFFITSSGDGQWNVVEFSK